MPWPTFLVIGAAKCGTTSLYHYLGQHPQVFMSPIKATLYFAYPENESPRDFLGKALTETRFKVRSKKEYLALFEGVTDEIAIGEASPLYLASATAAQSIHDSIPDVRLVVILRNPIHRAYSSYQEHLRELKVPINIYEAFEPYKHWIQHGLYYEMLRKYFDLFDKSQIKILFHEDLRADPTSVSADLYRFVGVDPSFIPEFKVYNVGGVPKHRGLIRLKKALMPAAKQLLPASLRHATHALVRPMMIQRAPPMPSNVQARLRQTFSADVAHLSALLNLDLESRWLMSNAPYQPVEAPYRFT